MSLFSHDRSLQMDHFQVTAGWGDAQRIMLAGDASFRKYWRLVRPAGSAALMDAPPPQEDVRPFLRIARLLREAGLSAPEILAEDVANGFLLLEDFGDGTYTRLLAEGQDETALYALATDVLVELSRLAPPDDLPLYDEERMSNEAALLPDWFLVSAGLSLPAAARADWNDIWRQLVPVACRVPPAVVLRDFHVDNLMLLSGRPGLAACGLLDFQDAVSGPLTYDLMSLLEDARRDIDPALKQAMIQRFLHARDDLDPGAFAASWAVMAAQRHAKVIGIFTRLFRRDGKGIYLQHLGRVWRLLEEACRHPACAPLQEWLDRHVSPDIRRHIPGQSS